MTYLNTSVALFFTLYFCVFCSVFAYSATPKSSENMDVLLSFSLADLLKAEVSTGTRRKGRTSVESPVVVDSLDGSLLARHGMTDMNDILSRMLPFYNVSPQPNSDGSSFVRPAFIRGLAPDHTLVLLNGKRFHRSSVVHVTTGSGAQGRGSHGSDIADIPVIALKRVEVLRDGAAAQYGSDAIAGVLNFILRDEAKGAEVSVQRGQFYEGENEDRVSVNFGLPLGEQGFMNISGEFSQVEELSRGRQNSFAAALISEAPMLDGTIDDPAQIWGRPEDESYRLFWNAMVPSGKQGIEVYTFGNHYENESVSGFFYRPITGIVDDIGRVDVFGIDNDGNCIQFCDLFPGGFAPRFTGKNIDSSQFFGFRKDVADNFSYDFSYGFARNSIRYSIDNTVNPALGDRGEDTQTDFYVGELEQRDQSLNTDFNYGVERINLAFGFEWRKENYQIIAGERASWDGDLSLALQGFAVGSNGAGGFLPDTAGTFSRENIGLYVDTEWDISDALLATVALRFEEFSDFGDTTNGKLGLRYHLDNDLVLRFSASTGFKAPTVGQANTSQVTTSFFDDGSGNITQSQTAILRVGDPVAQIMGAQPLDAETSTSLSSGITFSADKVHFAMDYFVIDVRDRIGLTDQLMPDAMALAEIEMLDEELFYSQIRYFTNAFDTKTQGLDVTLAYEFNAFSRLSLGYSWNDTEVVKADERVVNRERRLELEGGLPEHKAILTYKYSYNKWSFLSRLNFYSKLLDASENPENDFISGAEYMFDMHLDYQISDRYTFSAGAMNVFNEYPDERDQSVGLAVTGLPYYRQSPAGYFGGMWYLALKAEF